MAFRVRSKSSGSYFGSYATRKAAEYDAEDANTESKNDMDDWEPEEKGPPMETLPDDVAEPMANVETALKSLRKAVAKVVAKNKAE